MALAHTRAGASSQVDMFSEPPAKAEPVLRPICVIRRPCTLGDWSTLLRRQRESELPGDPFDYDRLLHLIDEGVFADKAEVDAFARDVQPNPYTWDDKAIERLCRGLVKSGLHYLKDTRTNVENRRETIDWLMLPLVERAERIPAPLSMQHCCEEAGLDAEAIRIMLERQIIPEFGQGCSAHPRDSEQSELF